MIPPLRSLPRQPTTIRKPARPPAPVRTPEQIAADKAADMRKSCQTAADKAVALINAGQAIKAQVKEVNEALARAYKKIHDAHHLQTIDEEIAKSGYKTFPEHNQAAWVQYLEGVHARDLPFDLHNIREAKHRAIAESTGNWGAIAELFALRAEVKAVPIAPKAPAGPTTEEKIKTAVLKTFSELTEARKKEFDWAKAIMVEMERFVDGVRYLPIGVRHVYCANQWGTHWIRLDWYLAGNKTAFNVIAAAAQATRK